MTTTSPLTRSLLRTLEAQIASRGRVLPETARLIIAIIECHQLTPPNMELIRLATLNSGRQGLLIRLAIKRSL